MTQNIEHFIAALTLITVINGQLLQDLNYYYPPQNAYNELSMTNDLKISTSTGNKKQLDTDAMCCFWASKGECDNNSEWMHDNCAVSCSTNICLPAPVIPQPDPEVEAKIFESNHDIVDRHRLCCAWAGQGECATNYVWMGPNCERSCLDPVCIKGENWSVIEDVRTTPTPLITTTTAAPVPMQDTHMFCCEWASLGECHNNVNYMQKSCPAACNPNNGCIILEDLQSVAGNQLALKGKENTIAYVKSPFEQNFVVPNHGIGHDQNNSSASNTPAHDIPLKTVNDRKIDLIQAAVVSKRSQSDEQPTISDTSTQFLVSDKNTDGRTLIHGGRTLLPDGRSLVQDGRSFVPDGRSFVPDGRTLVPDGRSLVPDGRSLVPDGRSSVPDGRTWVPDRRSLVPDERSLVPDGRSLIPDGRSAALDGSSLVPERKSLIPDEKLFLPDGRSQVHHFKPVNPPLFLSHDPAAAQPYMQYQLPVPSYLSKQIQNFPQNHIQSGFNPFQYQQQVIPQVYAQFTPAPVQQITVPQQTARPTYEGFNPGPTEINKKKRFAPELNHFNWVNKLIPAVFPQTFQPNNEYFLNADNLLVEPTKQQGFVRTFIEPTQRLQSPISITAQDINEEIVAAGDPSEVVFPNGHRSDEEDINTDWSIYNNWLNDYNRARKKMHMRRHTEVKEKKPEQTQARKMIKSLLLQAAEDARTNPIQKPMSTVPNGMLPWQWQSMVIADTIGENFKVNQDILKRTSQEKLESQRIKESQASKVFQFIQPPLPVAVHQDPYPSPTRYATDYKPEIRFDVQNSPNGQAATGIINLHTDIPSNTPIQENVPVSPGHSDTIQQQQYSAGFNPNAEVKETIKEPEQSSHYEGRGWRESFHNNTAPLSRKWDRHNMYISHSHPTMPIISMEPMKNISLDLSFIERTAPVESIHSTDSDPLISNNKMNKNTGSISSDRFVKLSGRKHLCCFWTLNGQCESNPYWMKDNCSGECSGQIKCTQKL